MLSNRLQLNTAKPEILWCSTTRRQNHLPSVAVRIGENYVLPSTTVRKLGVLIDSNVAMRSHVSRTVSGCFAVLRQLRSIRRSVSISAFHSLVVSLVMPRLDYCNATLAGLPESQLSRSQCRRQTDTSIFSVWARHTNTARPTLAAVSVTHWFQVSCAHLPTPARPGATVSFRLHPKLRRFQQSPSPVVVILAASDPTYTAVHWWWSCISSYRMLPLEQSATRRHLSFNAVCFSKPPQNSSLFPIISFLTVFRFLVLHTMYSSGVAVFVL